MFESALGTLSQPLSDYTFSQLFTWRNSLRIFWKTLREHLCVFANGTGDLTLLMPPIGEGGSDAALRDAFELMDAYNLAHGVPGKSRVEYASEELLARFEPGRLQVQPMGTDYLYDVGRMIDLAGGDLASKRQAKNRFMRNYEHRVELYDPAKHLDGCLSLLGKWKVHQDEARAQDLDAAAIKRQKESLACELALRESADLRLKGMVVYVKDPGTGEWGVRGFTLGEGLGKDQSSIVIEKTDLEIKGLAQFIFSEFCRQCWSDRPLVNVGDDWGLETLAWTKMSYRPVKLLQKYVLRQAATMRIAMPEPMALAPAVAEERAGAPAEEIAMAAVAETTTPLPVPATVVRAARKEDVQPAVELEQTCFAIHCLSKRQLQYLQRRPTSVFLVAEQEGQVVGDIIALVKRHKRSNHMLGPGAASGRIYSLAVSPTCRRQGIGEKLMLAMIDALTQRGVRRIYLEVEKSNAGAIQLYERLGFKGVGTLPDYYGEGRDGAHMMFNGAAMASVVAA